MIKVTSITVETAEGTYRYDRSTGLCTRPDGTTVQLGGSFDIIESLNLSTLSDEYIAMLQAFDAACNEENKELAIPLYKLLVDKWIPKSSSTYLLLLSKAQSLYGEKMWDDNLPQDEYGLLIETF